MRNKVTRLLICDPLLTLRAFIIVALAIAGSVQLNMLKGLDQRYAVAVREQALVARIRDMERRLTSSPDASARKTVKNGFSFEGSLTQGSDSYAIIDSRIYRVGDTIRDYRVCQITSDTVTLEQAQTGQQEILKLNIPRP